MRPHKKGTTLIEVLIASAVFSIMVVALFAILRFALKNWKSVEDRAQIQSEISKIQTNISEDLRKSSFSSVVIYKTDYRHAVAFKTFTDPDTGRFITDSNGEPQSQGYILYCLLRPADDDICTHDSTGLQTDNKCPHKIILKVNLTKRDGAGDPIQLTSSADVAKYIPTIPDDADRILFGKNGFGDANDAAYKSVITGDPVYVRDAYIIAKNMLSFNVEKYSPPSSSFPNVQLVLKAFKLLETGEFMKVGSKDLDDSKFTIQVDSHIIPRNP